MTCPSCEMFPDVSWREKSLFAPLPRNKNPDIVLVTFLVLLKIGENIKWRLLCTVKQKGRTKQRELPGRKSGRCILSRTTYNARGCATRLPVAWTIALHAHIISETRWLIATLVICSISIPGVSKGCVLAFVLSQYLGSQRGVHNINTISRRRNVLHLAHSL